MIRLHILQPDHIAEHPYHVAELDAEANPTDKDKKLKQIAELKKLMEQSRQVNSKKQLEWSKAKLQELSKESRES